jgi:hypothetical protein
MSRLNTANLSSENAKKIIDRVRIAYQSIDKTAFLPKAQPFNWDKLNDEKLVLASQIAYHCCVNGPVGVDNPTNFPGLPFETSIKSEFGCSNSQWKGFCYIFKSNLSDVDPSTSRAVEMFGEFWPTSEEMKNKKRLVRTKSATPSSSGKTEGPK